MAATTTLQALEALLAEVEVRRTAAQLLVEEAEAEILALKPAVVLLRDREGVAVPDEGAPVSDVAAEAEDESEAERADEAAPGDEAAPADDELRADWGIFSDIPTYRGRPRLPAVILRLMEDRVRRDAGAIVNLIVVSEPFRDDPPARSSIINRLNDLAKDGDVPLVKYDDGTFQLVSTEGPSLGVEQEIRPGPLVLNGYQPVSGESRSGGGTPPDRLA